MSGGLFRANPARTREGKVVVVQHRSIADPDNGGRYTVKRYSSEKVVAEEGGWRHQRITLRPDSDRSAFEPIVIDLLDADEDLAMVAEMLMLISEWGEQNGGATSWRWASPMQRWTKPLARQPLRRNLLISTRQACHR